MKRILRSGFYTKQRIFIVLGSLLLTGVLIAAAFLFDIDSLIGSLTLNLAASAITIGGTVTLVDYFLQQEKDVQSKHGRIMASTEAKSIRMKVGTAINNLFRRYSSDRKMEKDVNEEEYISYLFSYLEDSDFEDGKFKFRQRDVDFFEKEIKNAINAVEKINILYGYALSNENRSILDHYYSLLRAIYDTLLSRKYVLKTLETKSSVESVKRDIDSIIRLLAQDIYRVSVKDFVLKI